MRQFMIATFAAALITVGTPLGAFSPSPQQEPSQSQSKDRQQSYTGCLAAGTEQGMYILKTSSGNLMVSGSADLAKHIGHTVTVTGKPSSAGDSLQVSNIKQIAATCNG